MLRQMDQTFDSSIPWMEDQAIRIASVRLPDAWVPGLAWKGRARAKAYPSPPALLGRWISEKWLGSMWVGPLPKKNSQEYVATGKKWVIYLLLLAILVRKLWWSCGFWGCHFFQTGPYGLFHLLGLLNAARWTKMVIINIVIIEAGHDGDNLCIYCII